MNEQRQGVRQDPFIDRLSKGLAKTRFGRRAFLKTAVGTAGTAALALFLPELLGQQNVARAEEAVVSYQFSDSIGCGDDLEISKRGFSVVNLKSPVNLDAIFATGHVSYDDPEGTSLILYGSSRQPNGQFQNRGSYLIVYGGTPDQGRDFCSGGGIQAKAYVGPDGETDAGWFGLTDRPSYARAFSAYRIPLLRELNRVMRDPAYGNGVNGNGCEFVDFGIIYGPIGRIVEMGEIDVNNNILTKFAIPAPDHVLPPIEAPQGDSQPGFIN